MTTTISKTSNPAQRLARLLEWLSKRGIAHTSEARAAGFTAREIATLVSSGEAHRERRSWLVARGTDDRRVRAIRVGGRPTCISAAKMSDLWTPDHHELHVAVVANASRLDHTGLRLHWAPGPAPVGRLTVAEPMINVLFQVARCVPRDDALAVWESAIRQKQVDPRTLTRIAWHSSAAAELAQIASALSDSGLETRFADGVRRAGISIRQQVRLEGHPVDGLIGDFLVVQLDGFEHHRSAAARRRDIAHDARLTLRGYTVLRFDFEQVYFHWDEVLATIQMAMAQGLHLAARTEIRR